MNPYFDQNFFSFFGVFVSRMKDFLMGQVGIQEAASDEIQILVLSAIGISSALVGSFLIFRRMTMLANSLSHTILLGIVAAFLLSSGAHNLQGGVDLTYLLVAATIIGLLTTLITEFLTKIGGLQEDASIGLVFTSLFALGIVLVTLLTRNAHIGAEVVMGNVDALHRDDLYLAVIILAINLVTIALFFNGWKLTTFDPAFAKTLGFSPGLFNYLLMILVSLTVVGAFRAVGVLMVLTFITAPPLTARLFCYRLSTLLVWAAFIALVASFVGVALSRHLLTVHGIALSTGGVVVTLLGTIYLLGILLGIKDLREAKAFEKNSMNAE